MAESHSIGMARSSELTMERLGGWEGRRLCHLGFAKAASGSENPLWFWLSSWPSLQPNRLKMAGMDGNRTHPGRLSSAPQTVLKTAGLTSATVHQHPSTFDRLSHESAVVHPRPQLSAGLAVILAVSEPTKPVSSRPESFVRLTYTSPPCASAHRHPKGVVNPQPPPTGSAQGTSITSAAVN
jgi:hypothetical protein